GASRTRGHCPRAPARASTSARIERPCGPRSHARRTEETAMFAYDFRAVHYPLRLYSGNDALANLKAEVARNRAQRAFIVCGRSVARKTPLIARMRERLGEL